MQVEVEGVSKRFSGGVRALEDVSLRAAAGEFVALLGPSGCGKSTLLSMVAGLEKPDRGSVRVGGRPVAGPGPDRGVIFQEAALFPWLSVLENVEFGLRMGGMGARERRQRAVDFLRMVHLGGFLHASPHELSGGMRQRVAIARALALDPAILLMDEPFGALDEQTRMLLQSEVEDLFLRANKTVLLVTHNIREAALLADRIYVMATRPGRIMREFRVEAARPRRAAHPLLREVEEHILSCLKEEIEKVAREEMGADYRFQTGDLRADPGRDLGSHI